MHRPTLRPQSKGVDWKARPLFAGMTEKWAKLREGVGATRRVAPTTVLWGFRREDLDRSGAWEIEAAAEDGEDGSDGAGAVTDAVLLHR